jgi:hypothetical protein
MELEKQWCMAVKTIPLAFSMGTWLTQASPTVAVSQLVEES